MEALWAYVPDDSLTCLPGPQPDWSVKDLIYHLTFWQWPTLSLWTGQSSANQWQDIDSINARVLHESQTQSLPAVLAHYRQSGERLLQTISDLSEADLQHASPWQDGKLLWQHLADDTFEHCLEHRTDLRAWRNQFDRTRT